MREKEQQQKKKKRNQRTTRTHIIIGLTRQSKALADAFSLNQPKDNMIKRLNVFANDDRPSFDAWACGVGGGKVAKLSAWQHAVIVTWGVCVCMGQWDQAMNTK